jgi:hypothetical protein
VPQTTQYRWFASIGAAQSWHCGGAGSGGVAAVAVGSSAVVAVRSNTVGEARVGCWPRLSSLLEPFGWSFV